MKKQRRIFLDFGGHFGEGLDAMAKIHGGFKGWEVFTYEPNPACHKKLRRVAAKYGATVIAAAVGAQRQERVKFRQHWAGIFQGWTGVASGLGAATDRRWLAEREIEVEMVGLADVLEVCLAEGATEIGLKLDVEGAELAALEWVIKTPGLLPRLKGVLQGAWVEWHGRLDPGWDWDREEASMEALRGVTQLHAWG